jgi:hypothetical protein
MMREQWGNRIVRFLAAAMIPAFCLAVTVDDKTSRPAAAPEEIIVCRVLEVHSSAPLHITMAVFHQDQRKDSQHLADLLRQHSETAVEFETNERVWHGATVVRLKSCFGRGLLLFPEGTTQLAEKGTFLLKFPAN